ncbi:2-phosphosulfolactate phosphatase [Thalassorhabdus alkalitolerans]|uniref:Probable 2-phosphosulfolactate phosphatase n=1 Tax=Thalassorhabdus alkalitolerans TaxID=2282697 RepID=A0ABW0YPB1_9BACI
MSNKEQKKVHLLFKKEDIDERKLEGKTVVVFDILLATSTITSVLECGAAEVIPVLTGEEALTRKKAFEENACSVAGENNGITIEGFHLPAPLSLKNKVRGKSVILCTTNGTVAIRKSSSARRVFASSLLNNQAVADETVKEMGSGIVIICAGSAGEFCIEDFYGAGHYLHCLLQADPKLTLTDAARSAHLFYEGHKDEALPILGGSSVGIMLESFGLQEDLEFIANKNTMNIVPCMQADGSIIDEGGQSREGSEHTDQGRLLPRPSTRP